MLLSVQWEAAFDFWELVLDLDHLTFSFHFLTFCLLVSKPASFSHQGKKMNHFEHKHPALKSTIKFRYLADGDMILQEGILTFTGPLSSVFVNQCRPLIAKECGVSEKSFCFQFQVSFVLLFFFSFVLLLICVCVCH